MDYDQLIQDLEDQSKSQKQVNGEAQIAKLMECAADAIEELQAQLMFARDAAQEIAEKVPKWIPVSERLPQINEIVQITDGYDVGHGYLIAVRIMQDSGVAWYSPFCDIDCSHITHWMPLPQKPTPRHDISTKKGGAGDEPSKQNCG